ncbi:effector-associated domain EAD1-containing protein [Streptomyces sp. NPDC059575]|uniref:effector-associated domain EAD1-containing protein n=1 Tax=Streptomyces sp. NPDC059575 TaxID=3346872 RepID=UPI0036B41012
MTAFSTRLLRREGVLTTLAGLYPDSASAGFLLDSLGADSTRLPSFGGGLTPLHYWDQVCTRIEYGAFRFGLEELLAEVLEEYPGQDRIRAFLASHGDRGAPGGESGQDTGGGDPVLPSAVRILCLLAEPAGTPRPLRLRAEYRTVQEAARTATGRTVGVQLCAATRVRDVMPALLEHRPHVLHVAGHGSPNGYLLLEDEQGVVAPVHSARLAAALKAYGMLHTLVLSSCHLGRHLEHFSGCAAVSVGAVRPLRDDDALAFTRGFYTALGFGQSPADAFRYGQAELSLTGADPRDMLLHPPSGGTTEDRA